MEGIHGVDVSWLHHTNKGWRIAAAHTPPLAQGCSYSPSEPSLTHVSDHHHRVHAPSSPGLFSDAPPPTSSHGGLRTSRADDDSVDPLDKSTPNGAAPPAEERPQPQPQPQSQPEPPAIVTPPRSGPRRPSLLARGNSDKGSGGAGQGSGKPMSRRNSWLTGITSKFSSSQGSHPSTSTATTPQDAKAKSNDKPLPMKVPSTSYLVPASTDPAAQAESTEPYVPAPPKKESSSFFSSAFRRLSSSGQGGLPPKTVPNGGMCPRKVMNIDPNRQRCLVPELDQNKLRRVAFCVDVEIAGGPRYREEEDEIDPMEQKKKKKDMKMKEKGEGAALKNPQAIADEKDKAGVVEVSNEIVGTEATPNPEGTVVGGEKSSKKKEKKKRSEAERKERKENKRKKAEDSGSIPLELTRDLDESSVQPTPLPSGATTPKPQDKPTTDPLRIYRRCCQLRESPILKRITEQLGATTTCAMAEPGVVACLDLTGSRMQLADVVTLSDWLAVVPVKRLILEDSDLTDEGVRVILAGLLAAKVPEHGKGQINYSNSRAKTLKIEERSGVVEKLNLKNNPRISREGWKHISLFIYMCKSIKAIDVSMVPFPDTLSSDLASGTDSSKSTDAADILCKALSERLAGSHLEELLMAECCLNSQHIRNIVDGITISGLKRLSLAGNSIDDEGLSHVVRYVRSGVCQGLDLGGNDLKGRLALLCEAMTQHCPLWALCLADCSLSPECLKTLFPALVKLPDFRFLDLSHNKDLFASQPSALSTLRMYLPRLRELKRLHLMDVSMSPAQAIGLAEVLPECPILAHLNILENPQLSRLASATDEAGQEEACALYASLMAAVRVSDSIICVDIEVPSQETSEVVKALAKQVLAYCLRNMEQFTAAEALKAPDADPTKRPSMDREVAVPDVLFHLVGHVEGNHENHDDDEPAPDEDYIVGGTGVVKALSYCLSEKAADLRRASLPRSGTVTPRSHVLQTETGQAKAKNMSKHLLESARKIRARLQPALAREARAGDDMAYRRLLFLDNTLQGMIQRFEDEYPECRLPPLPKPSDTASTHSVSPRDSVASTSEIATSFTSTGADTSASASLSNSVNLADSDLSDDEHATFRNRHNSDVSLASRELSNEEGRIHRLGQRVRRDILRSKNLDPATGKEVPEPPHLAVLRDRLEALAGPEIRDQVAREGWEETFRKIGANAEELGRLERERPEEFAAFREAQLAAQVNSGGREMAYRQGSAVG